MVASRPAHYHKADLTARHREVLDLLAKGLTNAEIADRMDISLVGAKYHVSEVIGRLNVDSREEAADWWRGQNKGSRRLHALLGLPVLKWAAAGLAGVAVAAIAYGVLVPRPDDSPKQAGADPAEDTGWGAAIAWGQGIPLTEGLRWVYLSGPPSARVVLLGTESESNRQFGPTGRYSDPVLSSDGRRLALLEIDGGGEQFTYIVDTVSGEGVRFSTSFVPAPPEWAPDAQHLALPTVDGLLIVDTDGNVVSSLESDSGSWYWNFKWSEDSQKVAVLGTSAYVLGVDGTRLEQDLPDSWGASSLEDWTGDSLVVSHWQSAEAMVSAWDTARPGSGWQHVRTIEFDDSIEAYCLGADAGDPACQAYCLEAAAGVPACGPPHSPEEQEARRLAAVSNSAAAWTVPVEPRGEVLLFYPNPGTVPLTGRISLHAGVFVDGDQITFVEVPDYIAATFDRGNFLTMDLSFVLVP